MLPKIIMAALVIATGIVAALQMAHMSVGLVTSEGADLLCPALLYIVMRRNQTLLSRVWPKRPSAGQAAGIILGACYAWEFCQRYNLQGTPLAITRGTFDPLDLLAYTLGVTAVYLPDRFVHSTAVEEFFRPKNR
jgi:hypothetical protein